MKARPLMVQGTGSSAGKSLLVTALCRIFARRGFSVAPFKSQNMSLNSFITAEGHEIGRAQAVQAEAAGILPSALMNPVLLKPCGDRKSQIIVRGKVRTAMDAEEYYRFRPSLRPEVEAAYAELAALHDIIFIEGAGSPAEINLRENDLANMGMAKIADAPVLLVGDIDRGGVFASLYGTVKLLEAEEQARIKGFVVNKFRGSLDILRPGLVQIQELCGIPVLGVLPYEPMRIDEEDSLTGRFSAPSAAGKDLDIAVIRLPRMSNFTDVAVFDHLPDTSLRYVEDANRLGSPDLVILPGTKSTTGDLEILRQNGLADALLSLHAAGTPVVGICGGYQMLGAMLRDPLGVEGEHKEIPGLGLLPVETVFTADKTTAQSRCTACGGPGLLRGTEGLELKGYEIHMGVSTPSSAMPVGAYSGTGLPEGARSPEGSVFGTYLHGIFDNLPFTRALLNNIREAKGLAALPVSENSECLAPEYDRLADMVEEHLDMEFVERLLGL